MGKRQHQSDKMYITNTEWATFYGGYKKSSHAGVNAAFRRLPLSHCCVSLVPFTHPYIDQQGNVYDLEAILPFVKKFKINPVSGKPLSEKHLLSVKFHRSDSSSSISTSNLDNSGLDIQYQCPVLYKPFTKNTHVVAIKTTGNVFSYEAVEQLNIRANNWRELLTDEPFTRADIITLQDPQCLDKFNIADFHHIKTKMRLPGEDEEAASSSQPGGSDSGASKRLKSISKDTQDILDTYNRSQQQQQATEAIDAATPTPDKFNAAHYSTGAVAASLTSTAATVATTHEPALLEDHVVRYSRVNKKGYVTLETSAGNVNLELYCNAVPKTCDNFLTLSSRGYYDNTPFHRSIKHFMVQGGDPTGTGKGGECCWGGSFPDEFRPQFSHKGRGVLAMANAGPDTNKSQFFITFRSCVHLDGKHTIFGRVVGGLDALRLMEAAETDNKDRPVAPSLTLHRVNVFVNPFKDVDEQLAKERAADVAAAEAEAAELRGAARVKTIGTADVAPKQLRKGVGKFVDLAKMSISKTEVNEVKLQKIERKKASTYGFSDFSAF